MACRFLAAFVGQVWGRVGAWTCGPFTPVLRPAVACLDIQSDADDHPWLGVPTWEEV